MKSTLVNMVLSLGIITIIAAALLAGVYTTTKEPISAAQLNKQVEAIKAVTPAFDNDPVSEAIEITPEGESTPLKVFPAKMGGQLVGAAVESYSSQGFSGDIKLIYGFDADGNITGYAVMQHAETPGLGAKMDEWFRSPEGHRSVIGLNPATSNLTVSKDGGDVDAITAATITSRAFLDALTRAASAFAQLSAQK
ncbi:RnfABCDGE type electron transport complex subunit G [uncultured Duncaniella sp.]|uniref:RnfABCDGE type electron transport complex subunit G n=1 Tax=uncultured Duncaniella sp. TaxID=2768039 RepID=UPI0025CC7985|nr:RnfABCDGE type electron transport complex subunit G [uncultured Duncaniella sp.]